MAHLLYGTGVPSITTSDPDWYPVAAQIGKRANTVARRGDITAVVSETCGHGAPACFIPSLAELHVNRSIIPFGRVDKVDFNDRLWRLEHPEALFAVTHEASHARHTKFDPSELTDVYGASRRMIDVITTLEEPRIEYLAVKADPPCRAFMRLGAFEVVIKDFHIADTPYGASMAAGLMLARVDAGVVTKAEVSAARREIVAVLGTDVLDTLQGLWKRFLVLRDTDYAGMVGIAREWLEALGMDPDAEEGDGEDEDDLSDLAGGSMMGEGEGEGEAEGEPAEGEGSGKGKSLDERIKERGRKVAAKVDAEIAEARGEERAERRRAERKADAERAAESKAPHEDAFPSHGYGTHTGSHLGHVRKPTDSERQAARALARTFERLHFHDRVVTRRNTTVPPGRLRGGAAVAEAAARTEGRTYDGDLWRGKVRKTVESTPLTLGLLADISGSMDRAMGPVASTEWVLATAGAHVDAKVASVHFGTRIHGILRAGQKRREVQTYAANDGHEAFKDAALAIDRELNLLNGRGARLLVVSSDGHFVDSRHMAYAQKFVPLAISKGVAVIFLDFTGSFLTSYGATHIDVHGLGPSDVATLVGMAAAAEMKRLDRANA